MNILNSLLFSSSTKGFLWILFLFGFCFFGVHLCKLALAGIEIYRNRAPSSPEKVEEKKTPTAQPQEPIYYIVERKTRRAKPSYGEPKEIHFK